MRSLLSLTALTASISHAFAQDSGTFNTLTFNVAGLPAVLNGNDVPGDKTANTARIGQLFTRYNISLIHVQEDFNYHATLHRNDKHPFRTPTSGGVPFGSGLNTMSNYEFAALERVKWNECSNTDSADCLTPKGFTFMRVKFAAGVWIDAYNLHADAGTTTADNATRASNLRQVSDYIKSRSIGNAVLVFGDSNSRYTRKDDIPFVFKDENGMTDAWIEHIRNGSPPPPNTPALLCDNPSPNATCEIVDKTWYRGSPALTLKAKKFQYTGDMFLQDDGNVLSDHNGVLVDYEWTQSDRLRVSDTFGGESGNWYNDLDTIAGIDSPTVSSISLRGQNRVDAISLKLSSGQTLSHGGTGGTETTLTLNAGETVTGSTLCRGDRDNKTRIFYAEMTTSAGRKVTKGVKTNDCVTRSAESGWSIIGFLGRAGNELDQVGFVYSKA